LPDGQGERDRAVSHDGDEGSGYWIGKKRVAVVRDGRPRTADRLTPDILAHFHVATAAAFLKSSTTATPRREVAALGPVVQRA
jgi:N-acetylglucosamine kinase-like BadF-type ATPase